MTWFITNWFWILIFIGFIAMHTVGHGGHGRHRRLESDEDSGRVRVKSRFSGHQH